MKTVTVNASISYDVLIGRGILSDCGKLAARKFSPSKLAIVTDDTVAALYLPAVSASMQAAGFTVCSFVFPQGEDSKNHGTLLRLYDFLLANELTRSDFLLALGGGVVGDLAGYAASTYLRGIPFMQLPTTFLAAVDSSVGGKTAVNLPAGKNLVGSFYQPSLVVCDPDTFQTLPPDTFADGAAEMIKYGLIYDKDFFEFLESGEIQSEIETVVARCVQIKRQVVEQDERDTGLRMILNFGHTLGHAIEKVSEHQITHGHAVAMGMVLAEQIGEKLGIHDHSVTARTIACLERYALPSHYPFSLAPLAAACLNDKKRAGESIRLIFVPTPGQALVQAIPLSKLKQLLLEELS